VIIRALFFMAAVAVLMPHEPNLGLGRPGVTGAGTMMSALASVMSPSAQSCKDRAMACAAASAASGQFQSVAFQSLGQIKAEIEAQRRQREARGSYL
jgi:hypothetical protein